MRSDLERLVAVHKKEVRPLNEEIVRTAVAARMPRRPFPWRIILIAASAVLFIGLIAGAAIFLKPLVHLSFFSPGKKMVESPPPPPVPELTPPPPFFAVEQSRGTTIGATDRSTLREFLLDSAHEEERLGTIKRLVIKIAEGGSIRFLSLADFFNFLLVTPPANFMGRINSSPMLFVYYAVAGPRLGFAVETRDMGRAFRDMLSWEPRLATEFRLLYPHATSTPIAPSFEDRTYRNVDWRYAKFSKEENLGMGYALFPGRNLLLVVTSKELLEAAIDRLLAQ